MGKFMSKPEPVNIIKQNSKEESIVSQLPANVIFDEIKQNIEMPIQTCQQKTLKNSPDGIKLEEKFEQYKEIFVQSQKNNNDSSSFNCFQDCSNTSPKIIIQVPLSLSLQHLNLNLNLNINYQQQQKQYLMVQQVKLDIQKCQKQQILEIGGNQQSQERSEQNQNFDYQQQQILQYNQFKEQQESSRQNKQNIYIQQQLNTNLTPQQKQRQAKFFELIQNQKVINQKRLMDKNKFWFLFLIQKSENYDRQVCEKLFDGVNQAKKIALKKNQDGNKDFTISFRNKFDKLVKDYQVKGEAALSQHQFEKTLQLRAFQTLQRKGLIKIKLHKKTGMDVQEFKDISKEEEAQLVQISGQIEKVQAYLSYLKQNKHKLITKRNKFLDNHHLKMGKNSK